MDLDDLKRAPQAKFIPLLGNALEFAPDPLGFLEKNFKQLGSNFTFRIAHRHVFATADPEVFQHVLQTGNKNYTKDFAIQQLEIALGKGLLTNEGESWMHQRRLAQPAFYKKRLDGLFDMMYKISADYIAELKTRISDKPVFIDQEMMALTSDVVIQTLLGTEKNAGLQYIQQHIIDVQDHVVKRIRRPFFIPLSYINGKHHKIKKLISDFDTVLYDVIDKKKNSPPGNDLITMLLEAKDEDTGEGMSDKQLRDELITIYVAGHETSGYALSWAFYAIGQDPEIYRKLKEEVNQVFSNGFQGAESLKQLTYTRQVVDETLRKYPTAYIVSRDTKTDDGANGYYIPKGIVVLLSTFYLHRNKEYWKDPETFDPDRFGENGEKNAVKHAYFPFGGGPRMCIGNHFALMEITLVLGMMMYYFDFDLVKDQKIAFQPLVTLKPKYGIQLNLKAVK